MYKANKIPGIRNQFAIILDTSGAMREPWGTSGAMRGPFGGTSEAFSSPATGERSSQGQHSAGNELLEMRRKCEDSSAGMTRSWEKTCVREGPPSDAHRAQREGERPNSQFLPS